ncbi:MAG: ATP synthase F0 subunit B [Clostridiales bacterium]|nr:ATP synthase F0 subunit B [Clostridiales bacterium]
MNIPLNIDWQQILLHLFNFVILAGGLYFLLYKPVKNFMDKRTAYYQSLDTEAKEKAAQAQKFEEEYQARLKDAEAEIREKKAAAVKEAEKAAASIVADADKQKEQILARAATEAQHEKEKLLEEAKVSIAELAIAATAKLLEENPAVKADVSSDGEAHNE